jgi:hypothetical protein
MAIIFGLEFWISEKVGRTKWANSMFCSLLPALFGLAGSGPPALVVAFVVGVTFNTTGGDGTTHYQIHFGRFKTQNINNC